MKLLMKKMVQQVDKAIEKDIIILSVRNAMDSIAQLVDQPFQPSIDHTSMRNFDPIWLKNIKI